MSTNLKKEVGEKLKQARISSRLSQKDVATKMGMTYQQYQKYENGIFEMNYSQIAFLCNLFDISADYLLGLKQF